MESLCGPVFFSFARFNRHDSLRGNSSEFVCGSFGSAVQTADKRASSSVKSECGQVSSSLSQRVYFGVRIDHESVKKSATFPIHLGPVVRKLIKQILD